MSGLALLILKAVFWLAAAGVVVMEAAQRYVGERAKLKDVLAGEPPFRVLVLWSLISIRAWLALVAVLLVVVAARALWP